MSRMQICVLGAPEVTLDGRVVNFRTRKTLALLVFLALEPGRHSRERLQNIFWPDNATGRGALRSALTYLRAALSDFKPLVIERGALSLVRSDEITVDAWSLAQTDLSSSLEMLEAVCHAFRGELLEGLTFDDAPEFNDWLEVQREVLQNHSSRVLSQVVGLHRAAGALDKAIHFARRLVRDAPYDEGAYQVLIESLLEDGNRVGALEVLKSCRKRFKRELNTAPSPELEALLDVRTQNSSLQDVKPTRPRSQSLEPSHFVGREREWERLEEAWDAGVFIYIAGAAGVGKSRLMRKFAASKGGVLIKLGGLPSDANIPYASFARSVRRMSERFPEVALEPWVIAELRRIVPTFKAELGYIPPSHGSSEEAKIRLHSAIAAMHVAVAPHISGILVDDIHHFDQASSEASMYLISAWERFGRGSDAPRFIAAYRPDEMPPEIVQGIRAQANAGFAVLIELQPLELNAVLALEHPIDTQISERVRTFDAIQDAPSSRA
jgi:DNA-binding SARP family transcriptional activator